MKFTVNDGKVAYIMVAGNDYVQGEMSVDIVNDLYAKGEKRASNRFQGFPVCVDEKYFFAATSTRKTAKKEEACSDEQS